MAKKAAIEFIKPKMDKNGHWHSGIFTYRHLFGISAETPDALNKKLMDVFPGQKLMIDYPDFVAVLDSHAYTAQPGRDYEALPV